MTEVGTIEWDATSDPNNPGWVVMTATAGWQPLDGDDDTNPDAERSDLLAQAVRTLDYHDGSGRKGDHR